MHIISRQLTIYFDPVPHFCKVEDNIPDISYDGSAHAEAWIANDKPSETDIMRVNKGLALDTGTVIQNHFHSLNLLCCIQVSFNGNSLPRKSEIPRNLANHPRGRPKDIKIPTQTSRFPRTLGAGIFTFDWEEVMWQLTTATNLSVWWVLELTLE